MIAWAVDDTLRESGVDVVGPALDLSTGLRLAHENNLDAAVLDIDLGGLYVWPLARVLQNHNVPIVFVSAECSDKLPADLRGLVCLDKPAPGDRIVVSVSQAITRH